MEAADHNTQHLKQKGNSDPLQVSDIHRTHRSVDLVHTEVDLIDVFVVVVARNVVTKEQCVMHVVRNAT